MTNLCQNCVRWDAFITGILEEKELPPECEACYPISYPLDEDFWLKKNYEENKSDILSQ